MFLINTLCALDAVRMLNKLEASANGKYFGNFPSTFQDHASDAFMVQHRLEKQYAKFTVPRLMKDPLISFIKISNTNGRRREYLGRNLKHLLSSDFGRMPGKRAHVRATDAEILL